MDLTAAVEDLKATTADHAARLDGHDKRLARHDSILELLQRDMSENHNTLARIEGKTERIEDKVDGRLRDALNALPGWLGVVLALLMLLIAAITFGHDLWPSAHP